MEPHEPARSFALIIFYTDATHKFILILNQKYWIYFATFDIMMIPGFQDRKADASLLAGGVLILKPAKSMSKEPFFEEK